MDSSCRKCGGQIVHIKGKKYSTCKYCGHQNYFSKFEEIGNKSIIIFLLIVLFVIGVIFVYFFNEGKNITINNGEVKNYRAKELIIQNNVIEKTIIIQGEEKEFNNIDLFNCTNQESTSKFVFEFLTPNEEVVESESNLGISFNSNNLLKVKFYYLIGKDKNGKWVSESQHKLKESRIYGATYNKTPKNYNLVVLPQSLDGKSIRLVAYGFGIHDNCQIRVLSEKTIYIKPKFDLSGKNKGKNIDLIVTDIKIFDKHQNDLGKSFSKDNIIYYSPVIKNIGEDTVYINSDNLKFSIHRNNGNLKEINGSRICSENNIKLNSGSSYYCNHGPYKYGGQGFSEELNKKISIGIDYGNNIKETNEDNNFFSTFLNITK